MGFGIEIETLIKYRVYDQDTSPIMSIISNSQLNAYNVQTVAGFKNTRC